MDYGDWRLGAPQIDPQIVQAIQQRVSPLAPTPEAIAKALQGQYWQRTWDGATSDPEIVTVDQSPWGNEVKGWTACDKDKRSCQIMLLKNANRDCVERHERMHVAGLDHPDHPRGYICPD